MMEDKMRKFFWIGCFLLLLMVTGAASNADGETGISGESIGNCIGNYIKEGLENNLALKQEAFSLEKSLQALKEARGMFFPSVSIEARSSFAGGGRVISFPVGDLVNPIHHTLNQLLAAQGQPAVFPGNLENELVPFLREFEHETKLRIVQPVFQPAVYYNYRIMSKLKDVREAQLTAFKRQLVLDIRTAYFNYLKTLKVTELLKSMRQLLVENLRISESLFNNHKVTEEVVFRSKAELAKLEREAADAEKGRQVAAAYFNFLLNRPLESEIKVEDNFHSIFPGLFETGSVGLDLKTFEAHALRHRDEFRQMYGAIAAAGDTVNLHKASGLPTINAVLDYGFQGEKYRFTGKDDYWMASFVMSWNLFKGGQDHAKKAQAVLEKKRLETQLNELETNIRLQVKEAYYGLLAARKAVEAAKEGLNSWKEAFFIVSKKYEQGMVPQIEHIKAQNDYTTAAINDIMARYDYYTSEARLEQASAFYSFGGNNE
jgi:outer membrane protein